EQTISDNIAEAMVKALDKAIILGTGDGEPLGITNHTNIPAKQTVTVAPEDFREYATWPELFAKMPRSYRPGMVLILNDADWHKYIVGMTDAQGQPIARVNYGLDRSEERRVGKECRCRWSREPETKKI